MHEILFRAWDTFDKKMRKVINLDFTKWWVQCDEVGERHSFKNERTDRFILMQYTGLKDKNGVKIFEGDIVVCNRYEEKVDYLVLLKDLRDLPSELYGSSLNYREVVGNIYENPELLGVE